MDVISHLHSTVRFPVKDRSFSLGVDPRNLKKLLFKKYRSRTLGALEEFLRKELPSLQEDSEFVIPIHVQLPRAERTVRMSVTVWRDKGESDHPINVGGSYASYKPDLVSLVRKALKDKLPKLRRSEADRRILMLEIVTLDRDSRVHETVCKLAAEFSDFLAVDGRNFFDQMAVFRSFGPGIPTSMNCQLWSLLWNLDFPTISNRGSPTISNGGSSNSVGSSLSGIVKKQRQGLSGLRPCVTRT